MADLAEAAARLVHQQLDQLLGGRGAVRGDRVHHGAPDQHEIGTGVAEIGRSSFTFLQAIFRDGECAATGRATMVMIDATTRRARNGL